jgi:hypothetical protein
MIAYLRTTLRLPIRRIQEYLATMHHFPVSIGEITRLLHQVRHTLDGDVEQIKTQARASPILHADETGWRENGRNGYIWSLSTHGEAAVRWYTYDHSRASGVIKRLLAGRFTGHLVSDFYAGYNSYPGQHQRCWVHLLRDLRDLQKPYPLPEGTPLPVQPQAGEDLAIAVHRWTDAVRALYTTAKQWLADHPSPTLAAREAKYQRLMTQSHQLGLQYITPTTHPCRTLGQRLLRHEGELFQFVLVDGLAADNNPAERSVRHIVIMRKISGGSRSTEGTTTRMALASLFGTWQARGLNPFEECFHRLSTPIPQPT